MSDDEIPVVERMSVEELSKFIEDFDRNLIFSSAHLPQDNPDMLGMVFLPVGLGAFSNHPEEELAKVAIIWEYVDKAGPRTVNGFPIFFSAHTMHREDWNIAVEKLTKLEEARKAVLAPEDENASTTSD